MLAKLAVELGSSGPRLASSLESASLTDPVERRWLVRQAVLDYLFGQLLAAQTMPVLSSEAVAVDTLHPICCNVSRSARTA